MPRIAKNWEDAQPCAKSNPKTRFTDVLCLESCLPRVHQQYCRLPLELFQSSTSFITLLLPSSCYKEFNSPSQWSVPPDAPESHTVICTCSTQVLASAATLRRATTCPHHLHPAPARGSALHPSSRLSNNHPLQTYFSLRRAMHQARMLLTSLLIRSSTAKLRRPVLQQNRPILHTNAQEPNPALQWSLLQAVVVIQTLLSKMRMMQQLMARLA